MRRQPRHASRTPRTPHAPHRTALVGLAMAGVLSAGLIPVTASTAAADPQARDAVIRLINAERTQRGLPALTVNASLTAAAQRHAMDAVRLKWWGPGKDSHTNPQTGSTPQSRIMAAGYCPNPRSWSVAEITYTGWGGSGTPKAAVNWWTNVSTYGHRQRVLDPAMREIGAAAVAGAADRAGAGASGAGTYVVTFGRCVR
ncbi:CAP domain-containing protein [Streptomyces sp. NPDC090022]|uniref:CAP domain-containing protein n=1 Tax=Streptomyces sp. NPDC090022 TaxID=3365920 RepID=UPI00382B362D